MTQGDVLPECLISKMYSPPLGGLSGISTLLMVEIKICSLGELDYRDRRERERERNDRY